jgi:hypothetical protein
MVEIKKSIQTSVGKPEGKRLLIRLRCRWEDNIRMDLREIGWEGADWVHLIQDGGWLWAVVNMVKNHWLPKRCGIS